MGSFEYVVRILAGAEEAPSSRLLTLVGSLTKEQVATICTVLQDSNYAGGLKLQDCGIQDGGAFRLAESLKGNEALQGLRLPGKVVAEGHKCDQDG
jgi:hypothetical protein